MYHDSAKHAFTERALGWKSEDLTSGLSFVTSQATKDQPHHLCPQTSSQKVVTGTM